MPNIVYSKTYAAGEEVFRIGDRGHNAYFIESGRVEVSVGSNGNKIVIAELGVGEIFGEMSMIDDAPRSATVTAMVATEAIVIERSRLVKPLSSADPMTNLLLRVVLTRFRDATRQLSGLRSKSDEDDASLNEIRSLAFERINSEMKLRQALDNEEFEMHYQPLVTLDGGHVGGFEALIRWRKSDGGFVSPVEFIPLAEETGLIVELGRWVLERSLRDQIVITDLYTSLWPDLPLPFMSVNVSGMQLSDLAEIDILAGIINKSDANPDQIKLEITETLMVENADHAADALRKLKSIGVSIAIDDFGTGYSSLSYLHQFPLDTLKIDRVFVNNMDKSKNSQRIVNSIVQLALALDLDIVAEGIEELEQMVALRDLGVQYGQGFYMAKPQTVESVLELLESRPDWT